MRREELIELKFDELETRLTDNQKELEDLRFQKALQQLENPLQLRELRREIAQIKTALREYELNIRGTEAKDYD
ncbi:MAG: 50S ribosomal protein L29 [Candidatus Neomarinimicrobiota bacterium]|nr:50S ribosomal protein L29 [Candidatus Neomarinimicrobiota bacterium]